MNKKDVKTNLLDHSEIKVKLLGLYLKRYLATISNTPYNERIRVYDLFCGEGVYQNGGEGSPMVILREIKSLKESGVIKSGMPPIDCQFNDLDSKKIEKVKKAVHENKLLENFNGTVEFSSVDYGIEIKRLQDLFFKLKKEKAFVFVDPYGYKHIKASDIKNLLKSKIAEVLLFLPTQHMYRFDANGTPESLKDFIDELIDYEAWKETDSVWKFIEQLKEAFRNDLGSEYFIDTFTIQKDSRTVFCLFFFSSHIRGFEKMLEAKWEIDKEQGKGWEYTGAGPSLFNEQKTNVLEEKLKVFLKTERNNGELYELTLHSGFLPTHTVEILESWQNAGNIKVTSTKEPKVRKGAFYISYDNYKNHPDKVKFKL